MHFKITYKISPEAYEHFRKKAGNKVLLLNTRQELIAFRHYKSSDIRAEHTETKDFIEKEHRLWPMYKSYSEDDSFMIWRVV